MSPFEEIINESSISKIHYIWSQSLIAKSKKIMRQLGKSVCAAYSNIFWS